jgi:hypothetical protein
MFVGTSVFLVLAAFLEGYMAYARVRGDSRFDGWRDWLAARRGRDCAHAWMGQVLHIALPGGFASPSDLSAEDDVRAVDVMFELFDEFLAG